MINFVITFVLIHIIIVPSNQYNILESRTYRLVLFTAILLDMQSVIPLWKELEYYKEYQKDLRSYLGDDNANEILGEALYLMSIGTNDFLENYYVFPGRSEEYSIEEYQNFLSRIAGNFITELYQLGARKISLGGLPPMGCLPLERTMNLMFESDCVEKYNDVARSFNDKLQELVEKLNEELVEIQLVLSNPYHMLSDIIQHPESYGECLSMFSLQL